MSDAPPPISLEGLLGQVEQATGLPLNEPLEDATGELVSQLQDLLDDLIPGLGESIDQLTAQVEALTGLPLSQDLATLLLLWARLGNTPVGAYLARLLQANQAQLVERLHGAQVSTPERDSLRPYYDDYAAMIRNFALNPQASDFPLTVTLGLDLDAFTANLHRGIADLVTREESEAAGNLVAIALRSVGQTAAQALANLSSDDLAAEVRAVVETVPSLAHPG